MSAFALSGSAVVTSTSLPASFVGMREVEISLSIDIDKPPEVVWPYLVDWENLNRWMKEGSSFRVTTAHREGEGVEAEAEIRIGGLKTIDRIRVSRWEPPVLLQIDHLGWVKGVGLIRCFPTASGTHLFWKESLVPPWSIIGATGIRIFKRPMRRTFLRDMKLLKELVETEHLRG